MTFTASCCGLKSGAVCLNGGNWKAQKFSNPSGSYSANLGILARGQAGTKSRSLNPRCSSDWTQQTPAHGIRQSHSAWLKGSGKTLEMLLAACWASDMARHQKGPGVCGRR